MGKEGVPQPQPFFCTKRHLTLISGIFPISNPRVVMLCFAGRPDNLGLSESANQSRMWDFESQVQKWARTTKIQQWRSKGGNWGQIEKGRRKRKAQHSRKYVITTTWQASSDSSYNSNPHHDQLCLLIPIKDPSNLPPYSTELCLMNPTSFLYFLYSVYAIKTVICFAMDFFFFFFNEDLESDAYVLID